MMIFCGDSHVRPFEYNVFEGGQDDDVRKYSHLVWKAGATAAGFARKTSRRQLSAAFADACAKVGPKRVCFNLGQVDAEVGFYFATMTKGPLEFEPWLTERYEAFISHAQSFGLSFVVKGLNPSTLISDERLKSYIRRTTIKSFPTRSDFRIAFRSIAPLVSVQQHAERNVIAQSILQQICRRETIPFFDIRDLTMSPSDEGLAKPEFVAPHLDVHLIDSFALRQAYRDEAQSAFRFVRRAA